MLKRTQEEIVARFKIVSQDNDFDAMFRAEVLSDFMTVESMTTAGIKVADAVVEIDSFDLDAFAKGYLDFAIDKALSHRGLSAGRSVAKLHECAWLMDREDIMKAMDEAKYEQYGMPKLKAFAQALEVKGEWLWFGLYETDQAHMIIRMSEGKPCVVGCDEGCDKGITVITL